MVSAPSISPFHLSPFTAQFTAPSLAPQPIKPVYPSQQKPYLTFQDLNTVNSADVLVVLAHPDDELAFSGTLEELVRIGKSVQVVYATNGSAGQDVSGHGLANDALGETRSTEAAQALKPLKVPRPPLILDFMDGKTDAFPDALKEQLRAVLLQTQPGMVLMYNAQDGWTGHADHKNVSRFLQEELDELAIGQTPRDQQDRAKVAPLLQNSAVYQFIFPQSSASSFRQFFPANDPSWKDVQFQPDNRVALRVFLPRDVLADKATSMQQHRSQYRPSDVQSMHGFFSRYPYESFTRYQIQNPTQRPTFPSLKTPTGNPI